MRLVLWRSETPEEARKRRLCRKMLRLPPETEYYHVLPGFATLGALGLLLVGVIAWRLGHLARIAPALVVVLPFSASAAGILWFRRRYRHAMAGVLILAVLLSALVAVVHRNGYVGLVISAASRTASAFANSPAR